MEDEFRPRALFCRELRRAQVPRYIVNEGGAPWIDWGRVRVGWSGWLALTGTTTGRKKEEERIKGKNNNNSCLFLYHFFQSSRSVYQNGRWSTTTMRGERVIKN